MEQAEPAKRSWRINAVLFALTVVSVLGTHLAFEGLGRKAWIEGLEFTGSLLAILITHEAAHYIAARFHRVDASLPYFIPMPVLSPFGTMGAIIRMRGTIPTRRALLDIGASGPLAGLLVAIPLYAYGAAHSEIVTTGSTGGVELGEPLLIKLLDHFANPAPEGKELLLSPIAFGAWAGMFVTFINLLPVSQLDGGHVAYALFGKKQNRIAQWVHRSLLAFFFVSLGSYVLRDLRSGFGLVRFGTHVSNSLFWLVWFEVLAVLGTLASGNKGEREDRPTTLDIRTRIVSLVGLLGLAWLGGTQNSAIVWIAWFVGLGALIAMEARAGALSDAPILDHPPTGDDRLGAARVAIGVLALIAFGMLFMATPMAM
jgi:membrane-associated protease RseP (regulator of RpoE activity)